VLNECAIGQNSIAFNSKNLVILDERQFSSLLAWFDKFQKAVDYYLKCKNLIPEEQWKRYKLLNIKGLQEQRKLKAAKDCIREQWTGRPIHLKKETVKSAQRKRTFRPK
jgi:hypothetical protein